MANEICNAWETHSSISCDILLHKQKTLKCSERRESCDLPVATYYVGHCLPKPQRGKAFLKYELDKVN